MVTRVTGAPAIQEPRAGGVGGPSVDLRSTQVAIQNIRERFRLLELALNQLIVPDSTTTTQSSSSGPAGGPPGAIQYTDVGGGFAGSMALTWSATNQELSIVGDTYFYGNLYQNGSLLTFVTSIYADAVDHYGLVNLVAGAGISISALTGNTIEISTSASAGVQTLNSLFGNITLNAGLGVTISVLTGNVIEIAAPAAAGVASLNTLTGAVLLQAGSNVTITPLTGNILEISATGSGGGVTDLNSLVGSVLLQAGANVTITPLTGNVIEISASGSGGGVSSLNTLTGPVTIQGDGTVNVAMLTGNVIELSASASSGVSSLNYLTGPVTLRGIGIEVGYGTGNVIEIRGTLFTRSPTPPSGAIPGDRWVDEDTGVLYTWYDDGNSSQWVQF